MKNRFVSIKTLFIVACCFHGKNVIAQNQFSLKECILYSLENHPNSTIYTKYAELAKEKIRESKSGKLPTVSANLGLDYNVKLQTTVIPAGGLSENETKLQMGNKFSNSAVIQADQNIFNKSTSTLIKSSELEKELADLNIIKSNENIIYNTITMYYNAMILNEKTKLLQESYNQHKTLVDILKLRYQHGVAKKTEFDRAKVNFRNVESEIEINSSQYKQAINSLKNAIGFNLKDELIIDQSIAKYEDFVLPLVEEANYDTSNLIDAKIDSKNEEIKQSEIEKKKANFLPTLTANAKYGANSFGSELGSSFSNWFDYSTIGLKLNVPIFNGFKNKSLLEQSKIELSIQESISKLNEQSYQLNISSSLTQLYSSYENLNKNKENLHLAKEMIDASTVEYREGTSDLSNFLDAEYSYKEARTNYITSLLDYLNAEVDYNKSTGNINNYINTIK